MVDQIDLASVAPYVPEMSGGRYENCLPYPYFFEGKVRCVCAFTPEEALHELTDLGIDVDWGNLENCNFVLRVPNKHRELTMEMVNVWSGAKIRHTVPVTHLGNQSLVGVLEQYWPDPDR